MTIDVNYKSKSTRRRGTIVKSSQAGRFVIALGALCFLAISSVSLAQEKFTYWGGLIFSDEANSMFVERVEAWGEAQGIDVEVVMINQNETVQRVSAAIEAGNMPDALDLGRDFMLLLSQNEQLEPLNDLYNEIGEAHGGWLESVNSVVTSEDFGGNIYGIPYVASNANILYRRNDVLEPAGYSDAPETGRAFRNGNRSGPTFDLRYGLCTIERW